MDYKETPQNEQEIQKLIDDKLNALENENFHEAKACQEALQNSALFYDKYYTTEQRFREFKLREKLKDLLSSRLASSPNLDLDAKYKLVEDCESFVFVEGSYLGEGFLKNVKEHRRNLPKREEKTPTKDDDLENLIFGDDKTKTTPEDEIEFSDGYGEEEEFRPFDSDFIDRTPHTSTEHINSDPYDDYAQEEEWDPFIIESEEHSIQHETEHNPDSYDVFAQSEEPTPETSPELESNDEVDFSDGFGEKEESKPSEKEIDISNPLINHALSQDYLRRINFIKSKYPGSLSDSPKSIANEVILLERIRANLKLGQADKYKENLAILETIDNSRFLKTNSLKPVKINVFENAYNKTKENLQKLWHTLKDFVTSKTQDLFKDNDKDNR